MYEHELTLIQTSKKEAGNQDTQREFDITFYTRCHDGTSSFPRKICFPKV